MKYESGVLVSPSTKSGLSALTHIRRSSIINVGDQIVRLSLAFALFASVFYGIAKGGPHTLDTLSYNFQLSNGGGGAAAKLDNSLNIEVFCIDFANDIFVPHSNYSANLTMLTSSGFTPGTTRFGNNTNWRTINIMDDAADGGSDDAADSAILNNVSDALGRYQMAAYLVSRYNLAAGNNAVNNGIQTAIWKLMNPDISGYPVPPNSADASDALEQAAVWLNTTSSAGRDTFLTNYRIVSDSTMTACGAMRCGGFQEQITVVPEPKYVGLLLIGFMAIVALTLGKRQSPGRIEQG